MKEFFKHVDKLLVAGVTVIFTLILGFIWYMWPPCTSIPIWILTIVMILCYICCVIIYGILKSSEKKVIYVLPSVQAIYKDDDAKLLIFVVEPNDLFSIGALTSIYHQGEEDDIELLLGIGFVENINSKKNLQVKFLKTPEDERVLNIIAGLKNSKRDCKAIRIKPGILKDNYLEG